MNMRALVNAAIAQEQQTPIPGSIPAPVLGWNARDSLDGMAPGYAVELENFLPYHGYVDLRGGTVVYVDGLGGPVGTLARWADATTEKFVAAAGGTLWQVSLGNKISLGTGFSADDWQWDQVKGTRGAGSTGATAYLYLVNGTDAPQAYDGTTLTAATWTAAAGGPSLTLSNLHNVLISKDVLFLAEKDQLGFWHSAKGQVGPSGELSWFDLGTVLPGGGEIVAMATYTLEGGEGPDDYTCFIASTGWVALYSGGDPSQATDWSIIGRYPLGRALGKRCAMEIAGDVVVMTVNGYISLRQFIQIGGYERQSFVFNDNIQPEVVQETFTNKGLFGWQAILVPELTVALFNVPQAAGKFIQHVVNTQTAAWTKLTGWNGICWINGDNDLLFGRSDGTVVKANTGNTDIGAQPIRGEGLTAFSYMGQRGLRKNWQMLRPILETAGAVSAEVNVAVDFDSNVGIGTPQTPVADNPAIWDVGKWNVDKWGDSPITRTDWQTVGVLGYSGAVKLVVLSTGSRCWWKGNDIFYTPGGVL